MSRRETPEEQLRLRFGRDLCTCTLDELGDRWSADDRAALAAIGVDWDAYTYLHNPIYKCAELFWFDNVEGRPEYLEPNFHRDILCDALLDHFLAADRASALVLLFPRDSFKSTFTHGVGPTWAALRAKHLFCRDIRQALIHHKELQASESLQRLKMKAITHTRFKKLWPEFAAEEDFGTSTKFDWPCKERGRVSEPSILASGAGGRLVGFHFDVIWNDDLVTDEHILSRQVRDIAAQKYSASRFMLDTVGGVEVNSGTRYHVNDLWGKMEAATLDGKQLYNVVKRPAIADDNTLLLPNRLTMKILDLRRNEEISRSNNDFLWYLQYQLAPHASGLVAARPEWLRYINLGQIPTTTWRCLFIDPAWKGTKNAGKGDDAAFAVVAFERRGNVTLRYLLDFTASNEMTSLDGIRETFRLMRKWGVLDVAPEEHGGRVFSTDLIKEAPSAGVRLNLIELASKTTNKQERITAWLRQVESGHFLINSALKTTDVHEKFLSQFTDFPQCDHDDLLDACAYSCDPALLERWAPRMQRAKWARFAQAPEAVELTRYCNY